METKRLLSLTRKAIDKYNMIEDGDRIAVGISGGKDSLTLLYALSELRRFYDKKFDIIALTVDLGLGMDFSGVRDFCQSLGVEYYIVETKIKEIVFDARKEKNPCSLCAKLRKGALYSEVKRLGCNKVAYAHHKDDVVNTLFMSLMYEGRIQTLETSTFLDGADITVIRPLIYVGEAEVIGFSNKKKLPLVENLCPADGFTKREYVSGVLQGLNRDNPGVKERIFTAIESHLYENEGHK